MDDQILRLLVKDCLNKKVEDFGILFREVFADICMISILKISENEYIESLLKEMYRHPNPKSAAVEMFGVRAYTTLTALGLNIDYTFNTYRSEWNSLKDVIAKIHEEISLKTDGKYKLRVSIDAVNALLIYAKKCRAMISNSLSQQDLCEVGKMYHILQKDNFDYSYILEKIQECRKNDL